MPADEVDKYFLKGFRRCHQRGVAKWIQIGIASKSDAYSRPKHKGSIHCHPPLEAFPGIRVTLSKMVLEPLQHMRVEGYTNIVIVRLIRLTILLCPWQHY